MPENLNKSAGTIFRNTRVKPKMTRKRTIH